MIPHIVIPPLRLFGLEFYVFDLMVFLGFVVGTQLAVRRAMLVQVSPKVVYDLAICFLIFGILGAHIIFVLGFRPEWIWKDPMQLIYVWSGLSSYGGFLGAGIAGGIYMWKKRLSFRTTADLLMYGLAPGWMLGRLGCFSAHDHPGKLTNFFLAVRFPNGTRHDLGLYEALLALAISLFVYNSDKILQPQKRPGLVFAISILIYGVTRFFLDFLRASDLPISDARYFGLTAAQYFSIVLMGWAVYLHRSH